MPSPERYALLETHENRAQNGPGKGSEGSEDNFHIKGGTPFLSIHLILRVIAARSNATTLAVTTRPTTN